MFQEELFYKTQIKRNPKLGAVFQRVWLILIAHHGYFDQKSSLQIHKANYTLTRNHSKYKSFVLTIYSLYGTSNLPRNLFYDLYSDLFYDLPIGDTTYLCNFATPDFVTSTNARSGGLPQDISVWLLYSQSFQSLLISWVQGIAVLDYPHCIFCIAYMKSGCKRYYQ